MVNQEVIFFPAMKPQHNEHGSDEAEKRAESEEAYVAAKKAVYAEIYETAKKAVIILIPTYIISRLVISYF